MTLNEYRLHVENLKNSISDLVNELDTILNKNKCNAAAQRSRKAALKLIKDLRTYRKNSIEFSKNREED